MMDQMQAIHPERSRLECQSLRQSLMDMFGRGAAPYCHDVIWRARMAELVLAILQTVDLLYGTPAKQDLINLLDYDFATGVANDRTDTTLLRNFFRNLPWHGDEARRDYYKYFRLHIIPFADQIIELHQQVLKAKQQHG